MRRHFRSLSATFLAAVLLMTACATGVDRAGGKSSVAPTVLTVTNVLGGAETAPYAAAVAFASNGSVELELQNNWHRERLSSEVDLIRAVQRGDLPLAVVSARAWHGVGVYSFDAMIAPMAVDTIDTEEGVLASPVRDAMLEGPSALGLDAVALLPGPIRYPVGRSRRLLAAADFRGARIAVSPSPVAEMSLTALGALPVQSTFYDTSVRDVEGLESQLGVVDGNVYDEPGMTITANVGLWPRAMVVVANPQMVSQHDRDLLRSAAVTGASALITAVRSGERESLDNLCRRGRVRMVLADQNSLIGLRNAFQAVNVSLGADPITKDVLSKIGAIRLATVTTATSEAPSCGAGDEAPPPRTGSLIDGTYTMSSTLRELQSVSPDPSDVPENYGDWVFVFDRGRFAFTQNSGRACTWAYGTYRLDGAFLVWDMLGSGGIAPTHALNTPGEHFVYRWRLFHDVVTLAPVAGEISPENFWVRPWRRVSSAAQPGRFDKRCRPPTNSLSA